MYKQDKQDKNIKYTNKTKHTITTKQNTHKTQNTQQHNTVAYYNTCKVFFTLITLKHYLSNCKIGVHFSKCSPSLLFLLAIIYSTLLICTDLIN